MTAITALTAQSTIGVTGIYPVAAEFIVEQVRTVAEDIGVDAVKIGMLGTAETVLAVTRGAGSHRRRGADRDRPGDGVRVAARCCSTTRRARRSSTELLPLATVITPNLPEARVLAGGGGAGVEAWRGVGDGDDVEDLARALHALGPANVVVTGGHRDEVVGRLLRRHDDPAADRESAIPTAPRTGPAARTRARSRRTSRSASRRSKRRRAARAIASRGRPRRAPRDRRAAPVRSTRSASPSGGVTARRRAAPRRA